MAVREVYLRDMKSLIFATCFLCLVIFGCGHERSIDYQEAISLFFGQKYALEHEAGSSVYKIIPADKWEIQ